MKEEHCLVNEAREKCMCSFCKQMREITKKNLEMIYKWEAYKIWRDCFENAVKEDKK